MCGVQENKNRNNRFANTRYLNMRAFIAIDLPFNIKNKIRQIQTRLKSTEISAKWIKPENIHLTLKFLGNIEENQINEIKNIIKETTYISKPFQVSFNNFGFFPNPKKPKVFFISLTDESTLKKFTNILEEKLEKLGFKKEKRFEAHITLARIKNITNITNLVKEINNISFKKSFSINEIILFRSTLTQSGPIYAKVFSSSLTD